MNEKIETLIIICIAILLLVIFAMLAICISFDIEIRSIDKNIKQNEELTDEDKKIIENTQNSIVHLWGVGTGFIYKEDEDNIYIVTNKHVVEHYEIHFTSSSKSPTPPSFKNQIYLPYIKFIDSNIKYKNEIQNISMNSEKFSKINYFKSMQHLINFQNMTAKNLEYFAFFKTDSKHDIAMIAVPKKSLNISPEYQISKVKFAKQNPPHDQKIYVLGNAGGLQKSPILSKGNIINEYNPLESLFTYRDQYFMDLFHGKINEDQLNDSLYIAAVDTENFLNFVYHGGSTFDTKFWKSAKEKATNALDNQRWRDTVELINNSKSENDSVARWAVDHWQMWDKNLGYKYFKE